MVAPTLQLLVSDIFPYMAYLFALDSAFIHIILYSQLHQPQIYNLILFILGVSRLMLDHLAKQGLSQGGVPPQKGIDYVSMRK